MKKKIIDSVEDVIKGALFLKEESSVAFIEKAAQIIGSSFVSGGKLLVAGNGGSLCDAMHFAEELTGIFRNKRKALPAIALADAGHLSCVGNDLGYEEVFARGVEAFGNSGDVLVILTTSGNSKNLIKALAIAKEKKMKTIAFLGKTGGAAKGMADEEWIVSGFSYSDRVQEVHMAAIHIIIEMVEKEYGFA